MIKLEPVLWACCSIVFINCAPTLAGQLKDARGEVVTAPDARVNIISLDHSTDQVGEQEAQVVVAEVDRSGEFSTDEALPAGDYLVEALVPGYLLESQKVRIGETDRIELTMKPIGEAKAKATSVNMGLDAGRGGGGATLTPPSL